MMEITPQSRFNCQISVPGSKSLTQRALIAAALADGQSTLIGPLASEDTEYTSMALRQMGIAIDSRDDDWCISGRSGLINAPEQAIYLGNNGTATRFLTSVVALGRGRFQIKGGPRMAERPIAPLMAALQGWGVDIKSVRQTGCPPLDIQANGIDGGQTVLPEGKSSQYLSSLLLVAPYSKSPALLQVRGQVFSKPYVTMTMALMNDFGINVRASDSLTNFIIPPGIYQAHEYRVEGDASSASYFWAAAAISNSRVTITNVPHPSLQGDAVLVDILAEMGCKIKRGREGITVCGPEELKAIEVDMADCPDVAPTLAIVAAFARGTTIIRNIAHLRIKECDRLHVMATELARVGVHTEEGHNHLLITGDPAGENLHGAEIGTYDDHRIAMSFAVAGLRIPGIKIMGEGCVAKSFPDFWERFALLR
ncbi:MAG: 3-phosphoshikimate 1-carboxyvinyltransferase [Deltaproteobacteria bacterium]|nr:3-phosphoshikimate 1-carboxyvinyltransferase [Deltaproteobacteria bacterium]